MRAVIIAHNGKYGIVAAERADHIGCAHGINRHCRRLSQTGQCFNDDHILCRINIRDALTENVAQTRSEAVCRPSAFEEVYLYLPVSEESVLISRSSLISREMVACVVL